MTEKQASLLATLLAAGAEVVVVGGVAVNAHGYLRATRDLDIFFRPTEDNARVVFSALQTIGVVPEGKTAFDLLDDEEHLRFGRGEDTVDVLASIGEMSFEQVWRNRVETHIHGVRLPFISKRDLILNKRQTGRLRDLADVEELELLPDEEDRGGFG
jgi:Nucleotidyl transferase of unknown function (DUF2204)